MRIPSLSFRAVRTVVAGVCLLAASCSRTSQLPTTVTPAQESAFTNAAEQSILGMAMTSSNRRATFRVLNVTERLNTAAAKNYVARVVMAQPMQAAVPVPADRVVVTEELVAAAGTDDELAAAVAHQMGHLAAGHPMQKLKQVETAKGRTGLLILTNWNPGGGDAAAELEVQQLAGKLWDLRYSPEEERQAESYGAALVSKAGYKANSMKSLHDSLAKKGAKANRTPEYFSMHPSN